ncbi:MAG: thiamine pyrophosphate-binding protein [Chloroflexota bacterium]
MAGKPGRYAMIEQFIADGFQYMFGNPGTVEQGFLDALEEYPQLRYILTLQESVAVLTADGYARSGRRPALVQIHSTPGLGNAIGALYQAKRGHSPLVVIGGDAGIQYQNMDAQMAGDLVAMAAPVTKWSTMVSHPSSLLRVLRRAIKIAATPPMGPVYVCLPMDVLDAEIDEPIVPTFIPSTRVIPEPSLVQQAAALLANAQSPMLYVGDGVAFSDAQDELTRVAELLGAEVWEADAGEVNMSYSHPLFQGMTGHMFGYDSKPITTRGDVNLVCGTYMLPEVFPELGSIFSPDAKTIHVDLNAYEIGKNHPVELGMVSDPKLTLAALADTLEHALTMEQRNAAHARYARLASAREEHVKTERARDAGARTTTPLQMSAFAEELARQLPSDALIFDEALTNSPALTRYCPPQRTGDYFLTRGGSLGVGIPGAIGAQLAQPERVAVGITGDGGSMYTIQALWTAKRHNTNTKFIICNNGSYHLLQLNIDAYWRERGIAGREHPTPFDLSTPPLGFRDLAQGLGVPSVRVERPEEIGPAIQQALAEPGPFLIDLVLDGERHPHIVSVKCGQ